LGPLANRPRWKTTKVVKHEGSSSAYLSPIRNVKMERRPLGEPVTRKRMKKGDWSRQHSEPTGEKKENINSRAVYEISTTKNLVKGDFKIGVLYSFLRGKDQP